MVTQLGDPVPSFEIDAAGDEPVADTVDSGDGEAKGRLGRLPELAIAMTFGSLVVAAAFAAARSGHAWARPVYWAGELTIFVVPAAFLLFRRTILKAEALGIAFLLPVTTYLILIAYSPAQFRFTDEFSHVQTTETILSTHHLFHANTIVPVSPQYPGLEIPTTAIVSLTHLSITVSGMIVAGLAHLMVGLLIYFLIMEVVGNPRIAALTAVIYATSPHYQFFDSYYSYETIGLPFFLFGVLAVVKMLKTRGSASTAWAAVAVACGVVTAVSHHVTSYILVLMLLAIFVGQLFVPGARWNWRLVGVITLITGFIGFWDLGVATKTVTYFSPVVSSLLSGQGRRGTALVGPANIVKGLGAGKGVTGNPSIRDTGMEYLSTLVLVVLAPIGAWRVWSTRRTAPNPVKLGLAIAAGSIFLVVAIRLFLANGSELSGRALTFALVPVSFVCAIALAGHIGTEGRRVRARHQQEHSARFAVVGVLCVAILAVGGVAGGWPGFYARLPGPFLVSAWERSVDNHNLSAADWFEGYIPPNSGLASDAFTGQMMSALGHQANVHAIPTLFLDLQFTGTDALLVKKNRVSFVVVDKRITEQLPTVGYYFTGDPYKGLYVDPLPAATIEKFNSIKGISRIFDDGTITVFDLEGSVYRA